MESLNKTQLILLVLLVTFIVSIATAVMVVALLSENRPTVTNTINRVVETVSPTPDEISNLLPTKTEVTVVEKDTAIAKVVSDFSGLSVLIYDDQKFLGRGLYLSDYGRIVTYGLKKEQSQVFFLESDDRYSLTPTLTKDFDEIAFFEFSENIPELSKISLKTKSTPFLGQTVVHIGGLDKLFVSVGRITRITKDEDIITLIETDAYLPDSQPGSFLVTLQGDLIGLATNRPYEYIPYVLIDNVLKSNADDDEDQDQDSVEE